MTYDEFNSSYFYLWKKYPDQYDSNRKQQLFEIVQAQSIEWFKAKVNFVINRSLADFDWKAAVKDCAREKKYQEEKAKFETELLEVAAASTGEGYEILLKENGVSSVVELINKNPRGEN